MENIDDEEVAPDEAAAANRESNFVQTPDRMKSLKEALTPRSASDSPNHISRATRFKKHVTVEYRRQKPYQALCSLRCGFVELILLGNSVFHL